MQRLAQHRQHSKWFRRIALTKYEDFQTRKAALIAEKKAIIAEKPLYNVAHNDAPRQSKDAKDMREDLEVIPDGGEYYSMVLPNKAATVIFTVAKSEEEAIATFKTMTAANRLKSWTDYIDTLSKICFKEGLLADFKSLRFSAINISPKVLEFKGLESCITRPYIKHVQNVTIPQQLLDLVEKHYE